MPPPSRPLALRFLWGQFQGGVLPVDPGRPLVIGRQPDADLVLPDEAVSRRHARLAFEGDELVVEDLGSTNGTYLNGARVTRGRVSEGDRLLVGGSLFKVVARERPGAEAAAQATGSEEGRARAMQGRLEDVPLPDLLQLLASARKTGVLRIHARGHEAEVEVSQGSLVRCALDGRDDLSTGKSLIRMLAWTQGGFELRRAAQTATSGALPGEPLQPLLLESLRQLDELRRVVPRLPGRIVAAAAPSDDLDASDLGLLALAAQLGSLQAVLDATPLPDAEAARRIAALVARGFLLPAPATG